LSQGYVSRGGDKNQEVRIKRKLKYEIRRLKCKKCAVYPRFGIYDFGPFCSGQGFYLEITDS
jgi:hypothetical protein